MSVEFGKNLANYLSRVASLPAYNGYTFAGWFKLLSAPGSGEVWHLFGLSEGTDNGADLYVESVDGNIVLNHGQPPLVWYTDIATLETDTWYYIAVTADFRNEVLWSAQGAETMSTTGQRNGIAEGEPNILMFGRAAYSSDAPDIRMAFLRVWTRPLSASELLAERDSIDAVSTDGLNGDYGLLNNTDTNDKSGNGNHLIVNGTLTSSTDSPLVLATSRQSVYIFRNDDGDEESATPIDDENEDISVAPETPVRVRIQIDTDGDVPETQFQLEYKRDSQTDWSRVAASQPDPTVVGVGAQVAANTGAATLSPPWPTGYTAREGDVAVVIVAGRPDGSSIANTVGSGYTLRGSRFREVGTGNNDLWIGVYTKTLTSGESAPTVTPDSDFLPGSTTGGASAQIMILRHVHEVLDVAAVDNDAAAAATWTPPALTTVTDKAIVISAVATADDNALALNTANGFTAQMSGANYDTTVGSDHAVGVATLVKDTAGAVTMPVWSESVNGNDAWVGVTLALRQRPEPILLAVSANITASGEDTTPQLTPPDGKTTGDFTPGRIQSDENPTDAIDIDEDGYTEIEFCIQATSAAGNGEVYQFRLTADGVPLDDYDVTAQMTVAAPAGNTAALARLRRFRMFGLR
jgi:hypothetical protein